MVLMFSLTIKLARSFENLRNNVSRIVITRYSDFALYCYIYLPYHSV